MKLPFGSVKKVVREHLTSPRRQHNKEAKKEIKTARNEAKKTADQLNATLEPESNELDEACLVAFGSPATFHALKEAYGKRISSVINNGIEAGRTKVLEGVQSDYYRATKALKYKLREGGRHVEIDPKAAFAALDFPENQKELDRNLEDIIRNLPNDDDISAAYYRMAHKIAGECFSKVVPDQAGKNVPVEHLKTLGIDHKLFEDGDHNTRIAMFNRAYRSLAAKLHPDKNRNVEPITSDTASVDPSLQPFIGKTPEEAFKMLGDAKDALQPVLY